MAEIFRQETQEERLDFKPILKRNEDIVGNFKDKYEKKSQEFTEKFKPFCIRCARIDFKERIESTIREQENTIGYGNVKEITEVDISAFDLEPYGKETRFTLVKESKAMEPVGKVEQGTIQRQVQIGVHKEYVCKERGCGLSIFVPSEQLKK